MTGRKRIQFGLWLLVIIWMTVIFCFSAQPAQTSGAQSGSVASFAVHLLYPRFEQMSGEKQAELLGSLDHIIRKTAHAFIYFMLGIFLETALYFYHGKRLHKRLAALSISILYAQSDEIHQLFVPGRSCQIGDVGIDALGALTGILLFAAVTVLMEKRKQRKRADIQG